MSVAQHNIYIQRVNRVLDTINAQLDDDLSLKTLAGVAGFSEFHFHRIFKTVVGETVNQFVWRRRLERGAVLLRADPTLSVSEVALACGFASLAAFSRAFKARFGMSPTQWDRVDALVAAPARGDLPSYHITELQTTCPQEFTVQFRQMPAQHLAYIRVDDAYRDGQRIEAAYQRLLDWYQGRGGKLHETMLYGMSQDDPDITPQELCRFDWCLRVPDDWGNEGEIGIREFPSCLLAVIRITGGLELESRALQYFWRCWLPRSRYQPRNLPSMEIYRKYPHQTGWWDTFHIDLAVPVTRL